MAATHYANNAILDYLFRNTGSISYTDVYVGLSATLIDENGAGSTEPSAQEYKRQLSQYWQTYDTDGQVFINSTLTFPKCVTSWGTIVEIFIATSQTGGEILYHTKLSPSIPTYEGTQIIINPQTLVVSERI